MWEKIKLWNLKRQLKNTNIDLFLHEYYCIDSNNSQKLKKLVDKLQKRIEEIEK